MRISYSSYNTFKQCPLKYKFQYIDWVKVPERPEFWFGSLIHEVVQFALRRDPIIPCLEDLLKYYQSKWQEDKFSSKLESEQYFVLGESMLKSFHTDYKPGLRNVVASEKRFQLPIGKHILSGVIDRVDKLPIGVYEIIDYKTNKNLPTQEEVDTDEQLGVYNYAAQILWPEAKDMRLTLYFLKHNTKITSSRRPDQLELIKYNLIKTADLIEKTVQFKPKKNPFCPWCDYKDKCPVGQKLTMEKEAGTDELDQSAKRYFELKTKLENSESKLSRLMQNKKLDQISVGKGVIYRLKDGCLTYKEME